MPMKKTIVRRVARAAEPVIGSGTAASVDVSGLYIDMLCERFRERGIRRAPDIQEKKTISRKSAIGIFGDEISAYDKKYRTMGQDGKSYMSSDDFATYYKDLRGNKMPHFYSRDEREYKEAEAMAKNVQESGRSPKKALWLAIKSSVKKKVKKLPTYLSASERKRISAEWFPIDKKENRVDGRADRMPRGAVAVLFTVTLSLLLIVCGSVMVSRTGGEVSKLENKIERLEREREELKSKLEVKNDLLSFQRIAVEEYGMISYDFAASRYIDITEDEKIEEYTHSAKKESLIDRLLGAIGFGD